MTVETAGQPGTPFSFLKDIVSNVKSAVQENTPMFNTPTVFFSFFHGALHPQKPYGLLGMGGGGGDGIGNESPGLPPCSHGS